MKIAITGIHGFVGKNLKNHLFQNQLEVIPIERNLLYSEPTLLAEKLEGIDVIVNLSGANINKRWTRKYMRVIYQSRVFTTRNIVKAISLCNVRPKHLISTSAIGIYDDIHEHDEHSRHLSYTFLGKVCRSWETAALHAKNFGTNVSILRLGIVIGKNGGIVKQLLSIFKLGLGAVIGKGKQSMSFIQIDDLTEIIAQLIIGKLEPSIYNIVTPKITSNKEFSIVFAKKLHRPLLFKIPKLFLQLIFNKGADVLYSGQKVYPAKLIEQGYVFKAKNIKEAIDRTFS